MATNYVTREELKATLELTGNTFADNDVDLALSSASRMVDQTTGRQFWPDATPTTRYFTAMTDSYVDVGDLITLTGLAFDWDGDNVYELDWTALTSYWMLEPRNAVLAGTPYQAIRTRGGWRFPVSNGGIRVTGTFGWATVPDQVKQATILIANRLLKRSREAPFGVATIGADGTGVRVTRTDPDVDALLRPLSRLALVA
jgi:hypothetical protein